MSNHLTQRDVLYNAILRTVKETGSDMERGLVLAVLNEVSTAISMQSGREKLKSVLEKLKERTPRE